jgi:hypothetical protein
MLARVTPIGGLSYPALGDTPGALFGDARSGMFALGRCCGVGAGGDVHGCAAAGSVDDHADRSWFLGSGGLEVESLREAGDDEGEFHLCEREADAVAGASPERHPCLIGDRSLLLGETREPVGIEP